MSRDNTVPVRFNDAEKEDLANLARAAGLTASGWLRWIVRIETLRARERKERAIFARNSEQLGRIEKLLTELVAERMGG